MQLFRECEKDGHGIRAGQKKLLVQTLDRLKRDLDSSNPNVASYRYLVFSLKDENCGYREKPVLINVYIKQEGIIALPRNGGLGAWWCPKTKVNKTPNGVGLAGRVKVVKLALHQVDEYLSVHGYGSIDGKIMTDSDEWRRVMTEHSVDQESGRVTYYVYDQDGKLINNRRPLSSVQEIQDHLNGPKYGQSRMKILRKEINEKGLGVCGGNHKWKDKDMAQIGVAKWDAPDGKTYTIRGRPI